MTLSEHVQAAMKNLIPGLVFCRSCTIFVHRRLDGACSLCGSRGLAPLTIPPPSG